MKRLILSATVITVLLSTNLLAAPMDFEKVKWSVTDNDVYRAQAESLRCFGEFEKARSVALDIFKKEPGDGFSLRLLVLSTRELGENRECDQYITIGRTTGLDGRTGAYRRG